MAGQGKVYIDPVEKEAAAFAPATVANLGPGFDWMGCAVEVRRPLQCAGEVLLCEAQLQVCSAGALLPVARFPAVACARNGMLPRRRQPTLRPCATHTTLHSTCRRAMATLSRHGCCPTGRGRW